MAQAEAQLHKQTGEVEQAAGEALSSGEIQRLADGRAAVYQGLNDAASGDKVSLATAGRFYVKAASATTFAVGDLVYWDASASAAVKPAHTLDGSADFCLGTCVEAKASGSTKVLVDLNAAYERLRPFVYEFDCQTGVDAADHVLIPAYMNPHGLVIEAVYARVTEVFAGSSEDQGIVTVNDEDDNAIATLTASDGAADVVGDIIEGWFLEEQATGAAHKTVAAGKFVDAKVTQATSGGSPAGKMTVYVRARPLV